MKILYILFISLLSVGQASAFGWYASIVSAPSMFSYWSSVGTESGCYQTVGQAINSLPAPVTTGFTLLFINSTGGWSGNYNSSVYSAPTYTITGAYATCNNPISTGSFPAFQGGAYDPTNSATTAPPTLVAASSVLVGASTITIASGETNAQAVTMLNNQSTQISNESAMQGQLSAIASSVSILGKVGVSSSFDYSVAGSLFAFTYCFIMGLFFVSSNASKIVEFIRHA